MNEKEWISLWIEECAKEGIVPWKWDFKRSYSHKTFSPITFLLKYKNHELTEIGKFNTTGKTGKDGDCDIEPFPIYRLLNWQKNPADIIRGETMNSFITTFNQAILCSNNKKEVYAAIAIDSTKYLSEQQELLYRDNHFQKFELIEKNLDDFTQFANQTHTIGNFTVLPHWMNTGRYRFSRDYWDLTLRSLREFLQPLGAWENFVDKYFLHSFLNDDLTVRELWEGHFSGVICPRKAEEFQQFLHHANAMIETRGETLMKEVIKRL